MTVMLTVAVSSVGIHTVAVMKFSPGERGTDVALKLLESLFKSANIPLTSLPRLCCGLHHQRQRWGNN